MTPDKRSRLRELPKLIAEENDPGKMKILVIELQKLLDEETVERDIGRKAN